MPALFINKIQNKYTPRYLLTHRTGRLKEKIQRGRKLLENCQLCPRNCEVNRFEESGKICQIGHFAKVSNHFPHFGEEACLTGFNGSGTIFFISCNLRCVFCQNWDISHSNNGRGVQPEELANIMMDLQDRGCHNINFVTPSHVVVQILEALEIAINLGLHLPLVYNTSAYDNEISLELLDGIIDIYMPDFKFWNPQSAKLFLNAQDYPEIAKRNLKNIYRQVGDLKLDSNGIAYKGLLIRHLVMPGQLNDTKHILNFIANEISIESAVNVMFQYHPEYITNSAKFESINRLLTESERETALEYKTHSGLPDYSWL
jgi:putative pyruvate formate lyase activating enzyme